MPLWQRRTDEVLGSSLLAVSEKIFGLPFFLDFLDRCANACSLYPLPAALTGPPLAVPETADARFHSRRFDRCANACSLYPLPAALTGVARFAYGLRPSWHAVLTGPVRPDQTPIHPRAYR